MDQGGAKIWIFLFLLLNISASAGKYGYSLFSRNFVSVNINEHQHRELRIAFKSILVLETSAFWDTPQSLTLRQVTDGRRLVQAVYQQGSLKDCDYTESTKTILDFIDNFVKAKLIVSKRMHRDVFAAYNSSKILTTGGAYSPLRDRKSLRMFKYFIDIKGQTRSCHKFYKKVRKETRRHKLAERRRRKKHQINTSEESNFTDSHPRSKRDLFSGWLIFPGTKWCGDGDIAESLDDLGYDERTDSCCRAHDNCPYIIERFSWNFNLFNYRLHTLSHCECDISFRKCLKQSTSSTANLVGKIFFNIIGPQCFDFKEEKTCLRRNWWGVCKKYGVELVAYPRDPVGF